MRAVLLNIAFAVLSLNAFANTEIAALETEALALVEQSIAAPVVAVADVPKIDSVSNVETDNQETKADDKLPAKVDVRAESEIPLNLQASKKADSDNSSAVRIFLSLIVICIVGAGAFIFLKRYAVPKTAKHQTQIKVLQQHFLGPKKSLAIIRVAGESILVGITDHNINLIKSLSLLDDEVPEESPQKFNSVMDDFEEEVVAPVKSKSAAAKELDKDEEFAISGIKDIVSKRLKGMRNFQ